ETLRAAHRELAGAGAAPRFVGVRLGRVEPARGAPIDVEVTLETAPSATWDAVVVPGNDAALAAYGQAHEFLRDQYRHCKPMLFLVASSETMQTCTLPQTLPDGSADPGLVS